MARLRDEWGRVLDKQAEDTKLAFAQERQAKEQVKQTYAQQLEHQMQIRKQREQQLRDYELQLDKEDIVQKNQFSEQFAVQRAVENQDIKKQLAQDYNKAQDYIQQVKVDQKYNEVQAENTNINAAQKQLLDEQKRRLEVARNRKTDEDQVLNFFRARRLTEKESTEQEKLAEQHRMFDYQQKEYQRLAERQQQIQDRVQKTNAKEQNFDRTINKMDAQRRIEEMERLRNQERTRNAMQMEKLSIEEQIKIANQQQINDANRMLLMQKEEMKKREQEEHLQDQRVVREREQLIKANERERAQQISQLKQSYNWNLGQQVTEKQKQHVDTYYLTEHEKRLNRHYLESNQDPTRGRFQDAANYMVNNPTPVARSPGISPSPAQLRQPKQTPVMNTPTPVPSSQTPAESGFDSDVRKFYGATPELNNRNSRIRRSSNDPSPSRLQRDKSPVADRSMFQRQSVPPPTKNTSFTHNPITNPLGAVVPMPTNGRPLYNVRNNFSSEPLAGFLRSNNTDHKYYVHNFG